MTSIYILTFKESGEKHYFTSLIAIYGRFSREQIKVAYNTLGAYNFKQTFYENKVVTIERVYAMSKKDFPESFT